MDESILKYHDYAEAYPVQVGVNQLSQIHQHAKFVSDFVKKSGKFSDMIAELILNHHERWDKSGYPGAKGHEQISPDCALFIIAELIIHRYLENTNDTGKLKDYMEILETQIKDYEHFKKAFKLIDKVFVQNLTN